MNIYFETRENRPLFVDWECSIRALKAQTGYDDFDIDFAYYCKEDDEWYLSGRHCPCPEDRFIAVDKRPMIDHDRKHVWVCFYVLDNIVDDNGILNI